MGIVVPDYSEDNPTTSDNHQWFPVPNSLLLRNRPDGSTGASHPLHFHKAAIGAYPVHRSDGSGIEPEKKCNSSFFFSITSGCSAGAGSSEAGVEDKKHFTLQGRLREE